MFIDDSERAEESCIGNSSLGRPGQSKIEIYHNYTPTSLRKFLRNNIFEEPGGGQMCELQNSTCQIYSSVSIHTSICGKVERQLFVYRTEQVTGRRTGPNQSQKAIRHESALFLLLQHLAVSLSNLSNMTLRFRHRV